MKRTMIYIKDMDMPVDCMECKIDCKHENYLVTGRPEDCPLEEAKTGDLISRADAIALLTEIVFDEPPYFDSETLCRLYAEEQINTLPSAEIAETESIAIRSRTLMPTKDFKEWAKRIREVNPNAIVIPCDAEVVSADAVSREEYEETDGVIKIKKQRAKDVGEIKHIVVCSPNYTRYFYNDSMPTQYKIGDTE